MYEIAVKFSGFIDSTGHLRGTFAFPERNSNRTERMRIDLTRADQTRTELQ